MTTASLPIIDIAPWIDKTSEDLKRRTSAALHAACVDFGFFYLDISTYTSPAELDELLSLAGQFFALPSEEKDSLSMSLQDHTRGYAGVGVNVTNGKPDTDEGIDFYRPVDEPDKSKPLMGENQWPTMVPAFREKFETWVEKMKILGFIVMEAMAVGLGLNNEQWMELRSMVDDSFWGMRVIGYPPLTVGHNGYSCGPHKDYGCLTFLYSDPTPSALQVFHRGIKADSSGQKIGQWINADPIPGRILCNIGEMWEIWTAGLYKSTLHQVIHHAPNYRISSAIYLLDFQPMLIYVRARIPFFFEPNFDAIIAPLMPVNEIEKKTYTPVRYGDFLVSKVCKKFFALKGVET